MTLKILIITLFVIINASAFKLDRKERGVDENPQAEVVENSEAFDEIKSITSRFSYESEGA